MSRSLSPLFLIPCTIHSRKHPLRDLPYPPLPNDMHSLSATAFSSSSSTTPLPPLVLPPADSLVVSASPDNGFPSKFDYDLVIIGACVGSHRTSIHAVEKAERGCVPSKALLAVSGRMRELQGDNHLKSLELQVADAGYDRQGVPGHPNNLTSKIRSNLTKSMKALGVDILTGVK